MSDHSAIYLKVYLSCRRKDTIQRLNVGTLNNKLIFEQIKADIQSYLEENKKGHIRKIDCNYNFKVTLKEIKSKTRLAENLV